MDLSGKNQRLLADALRYRIEWCDAAIATATVDAKAALIDDRECLVALLDDLAPARHSTKPGHG
jgi:hypothetical protein